MKTTAIPLQPRQLDCIRGGQPLIPYRPGYIYCGNCKCWFVEGDHDISRCDFLLRRLIGS